MIHDILPKLIKPLELAKEQRAISGYCTVADIDNLSDICLEAETKIHVTLCFSYDLNRYCVINATVEADLQLTCQRCLKPILQRIDVSCRLSPVVTDDEAKKLPGIYEPVYMDDDGAVNLLALVSEEIWLQNPTRALHQNDDCQLNQSQFATDSSHGHIDNSDKKTQNPFKDLHNLLNT